MSVLKTLQYLQNKHTPISTMFVYFDTSKM